MILTVTKDDTIIFQDVVTATVGANMIKTGIAQPGAIYNIGVETAESFDFTQIDIADNAAVTSADSNLMQPIICRVDQNTPDRSVYLRWIGLTGSWNYYRFVYNQIVGLDVSDTIVIKNFVIDWANGDTIEDVMSKNAGPKMTVNAENMSVDDIKGCQGIKFSPKVQMLTSLSPLKWQTVVVQSSSFTEMETMLDYYSFSVTFNLPSLNIQKQ
jgi:hypothetical protein